MSTEEILNMSHFSQVIIDLVKERTYGPNFLITGSLGGSFRYHQPSVRRLIAQRVLVNLRHRLSHEGQVGYVLDYNQSDFDYVSANRGRTLGLPAYNNAEVLPFVSIMR
jgi:hypothetical protein